MHRVTRWLAVGCLSAVVVCPVSAKGRRGDYVTTGSEDAPIRPVKRGSAANPNPAFMPPRFDSDQPLPTTISSTRPSSHNSDRSATDPSIPVRSQTQATTPAKTQTPPPAPPTDAFPSATAATQATQAAQGVQENNTPPVTPPTNVPVQTLPTSQPAPGSANDPLLQ